MISISERLRRAPTPENDPNLPDEAADELDRLTARVAELESVIGRCSRVMRGEDVNDQGEAWDLTLRTLDAALEHKHD